MDANEEWRAVPGYGDRYEVSNLGRVRRIRRTGYRGKLIPDHYLTPDVRPSGHLRVSLSLDSRVTRVWVHHLVLKGFVGPQPEGTEACHNDGDPTNNVAGNLRWDTKSANARDRQLHGTDHNARKTHCPKGHEYSSENTYLSGNGHRRCRTCILSGQRESKESINASRRRRYARRKAA